MIKENPEKRLEKGNLINMSRNNHIGELFNRR